MMCFFYDFILHIAYIVDACALTNILSSLPLIDIIYCTPDTKATPASVHGVGVNFRLICISLLHNIVNRVHHRTAHFRCVFGSTDSYGV
jgi:hypothetical protein